MHPGPSIGAAPSADHRARVLAAIRADPGPRRASRQAGVALVWLGALALEGTAFIAAGGPSLEPRPAALVWATAFGAFTIALVALEAFVRRRSMLGPPREVLLFRSLVTLAALVTWKLVWTSVHLPYEGWDVGPWPALRCALVGLALALGPLVAGMVHRRRTDPLQPSMTGFALGCASGAWAWACLDLMCPSAEPTHLVFGHLVPVVATGLVGALVGSRLLPPR